MSLRSREIGQWRDFYSGSETLPVGERGASKMVDVSGFHPNCGGAASASVGEGEAEQLRDFSKSPVS